MGKHEAPLSWREEWMRMMREAWVPVVHICGGLFIHAGTVYLYYTWTH